MLTVVGDLVADLIVLGHSHLERGTDNPAEVRLARGGSAANVAVAAATATIAGAAQPVCFIGRIGDDPLGETLVAALTRAGVEARVQRGGRTGAIVVLVDDEDGERTMITDRGAAAELETIDDAWLADAEWVHFPLYGFAPPVSREALIDGAKRLHERGVPTSLDLSSTATMRDLGRDGLASILAELAPAVVFANEDEADLAAALGLELAPDGVYVVKRGADPVILKVGGHTSEIMVERVDEVTDSTGAGDAFAAGYLVATMAGAGPADAARAGITRAGEAVRRAGAI